MVNTPIITVLVFETLLSRRVRSGVELSELLEGLKTERRCSARVVGFSVEVGSVSSRLIYGPSSVRPVDALLITWFG